MNNDEIKQKYYTNVSIAMERAIRVEIPISIAFFIISQIVYSTVNSMNLPFISGMGFAGSVLGTTYTLFFIYYWIKSMDD